ncbi:16S rRNA (cytidine(1402)-2'-O)-methyltransferase [Alkalicoccus urumqiensis]|uniref:Ribosomal RNA small subunit methyltransferase I n=1 Tax=Alkalicoccus urumqiensis TaxID=1548213 RepID=A0A2P6MDM9_ALKUR|nr:16S rRNA (cytidine(1402)-2'-O)-methyltransferase [Alkalicoccus urumqiensis]PRO64382.1 16S rRNA (cytidine(1402)-2'-O)-methyltransferase [Alkalicoccus urumqiensis]
MHEQQSYRGEERGMLTLVPTPIGNLEDMTYRAVSVLQAADVIAAEDTRHTKKLCHAFEIQTPLISYHEHNMHTRGPELLERIRSGEHVALVSDAGTPAISDPGARLTQEAKAEQLTVTALPGANAALTALTASGLPTEAFLFAGFVSRQKKKRIEELEQWKPVQATLLFYESPHRVAAFLQAALEVYGTRRAVIAREMTKQYETIISGTIEELAAWSGDTEIRGECVVLIEGADDETAASLEPSAWWEELTPAAHAAHYVEKEGMKPKDAVKLAAKERGVPKRDVYQAYHVDTDD